MNGYFRLKAKVFDLNRLENKIMKLSRIILTFLGVAFVLCLPAWEQFFSVMNKIPIPCEFGPEDIQNIMECLSKAGIGNVECSIDSRSVVVNCDDVMKSIIALVDNGVIERLNSEELKTLLFDEKTRRSMEKMSSENRRKLEFAALERVIKTIDPLLKVQFHYIEDKYRLFGRTWHQILIRIQTEPGQQPITQEFSNTVITFAHSILYFYREGIFVIDQDGNLFRYKNKMEPCKYKIRKESHKHSYNNGFRVRMEPRLQSGVLHYIPGSHVIVIPTFEYLDDQVQCSETASHLEPIFSSGDADCSSEDAPAMSEADFESIQESRYSEWEKEFEKFEKSIQLEHVSILIFLPFQVKRDASKNPVQAVDSFGRKRVDQSTGLPLWERESISLSSWDIISDIEKTPIFNAKGQLRDFDSGEVSIHVLPWCPWR